jgi:archaellum component FlaC
MGREKGDIENDLGFRKDEREDLANQLSDADSEILELEAELVDWEMENDLKWQDDLDRASDMNATRNNGGW